MALDTRLAAHSCGGSPGSFSRFPFDPLLGEPVARRINTRTAGRGKGCRDTVPEVVTSGVVEAEARRVHEQGMGDVTGQRVDDAGGRFLLLDGLRGVAAFAVILDHVPGGWLGEMVPGRYLSVDFFFVLSGFVLAHAYGRRLGAGWSPFAFMAARLIRLYPMYLMALAIGMGLAVLGALRGWTGPGWGDIPVVAGFSLLFLPTPPGTGFGHGELYPANAPAWSLFFELAANAAYGLAARFLTWRVMALILVMGAGATAFTLLRHQGTGGPGWLWQHMDAGLARVTYGFFAGVAIYRLRGQVKLWAMPWWLAVAAFVAIIAVRAPEGWRVAYDIAAGLVLMPLLVMFACGAKVSGGVARACGVFGVVSYGVYVLHVPLFASLGVAAGAAGTALGEGPVLALAVGLLAALAAGVAHFVYDKPVRRWFTQRFMREKAHNTATKGG